MKAPEQMQLCLEKRSGSGSPKLVAGEKPGTYRLNGEATKEQILGIAKDLARKQLRKGSKLDQPSKVVEYLQTLMMDYPHEVFGVVLLDNKHRIIRFDELFRGTIDAASVYPREVVKHALLHNAAAVIFVHNHPSGDPEPSAADHCITQRLKETLDLVEIRTLDHFVVGSEGYVSFAERGKI